MRSKNQLKRQVVVMHPSLLHLLRMQWSGHWREGQCPVELRKALTPMVGLII